MALIMRRLVQAGITMLAGYAMKKFMASLEAQAKKMQEAQRSQGQPQSQPHAQTGVPKDVRPLKRDPETGVYYAED